MTLLVAGVISILWGIGMFCLIRYFQGGPSKQARTNISRLGLRNADEKQKPGRIMAKSADKEGKTNATLAKLKENVTPLLEETDLGWSFHEYLMLCIACALGTLGLAGILRNPWVALLAVPISYYGPMLYIQYKREQTKRKLIRIANPAIQAIASGYSLHKSFVQAVIYVLPQIEEPLKSHFQEMLLERDSGTPLKQCFENLKNKLKIPALNAFLDTVSIAEEMGGPKAPQIIRQSSNVVAENELDIAELESEIAEPQRSTKQLFALEIVGLACFLFVQGDFSKFYLNTAIGKFVIFYIAASTAVAFWYYRELCKPIE